MPAELPSADPTALQPAGDAALPTFGAPLLVASGPTSPVEILLVEDNAADMLFTRQVVQHSELQSRLTVADDDVERAYTHHVNAYIRRPVDLGALADIVGTIHQFWCTVAILPNHRPPGRRG